MANTELQKLQQIVDSQYKTLEEIIGDPGQWEAFTEQECELAKEASITDLILLLREKQTIIDNINKLCENDKHIVNGKIERYKVVEDILKVIQGE